MEKEIRKLAILILDDSNGISVEAFTLLEDILKETGSKDIVNEVIYEAGRVFLGEDTVEELLNGMDKSWHEKLDDRVEEIMKDVPLTKDILPGLIEAAKTIDEEEGEEGEDCKNENSECNISVSDIMKDVRNARNARNAQE